MILEILTPQKQLYAGSVKQVDVPGSNGKFQILKNHAAIITSLIKGDVKIIDVSNTEHIIAVLGGFVEVKENKIIILANTGQD